MPTFKIPVPADYLLARDCCSYGYFVLEPNRWDPPGRCFTTTLDLSGGATTLRITQGRPPAEFTATDALAPYDPDDPGPGVPGTPLTVRADRELDAAERAGVRVSLAHVLRLDESTELIAGFHAADPRFARSGRGRLMRSPSLFEDIIKTVTSCNVTWPSTVSMNRKLCRVFGRRSASGGYAFPTAAKLARARPGVLRARCSVGYRDARIVELAKLFAPGDRGRTPRGSDLPSPAWIADPNVGDDDLFKGLQELPGVGPYAAANIMQLLGRYSRLPLDTESIRHGRTILGLTGTGAQVMKRVHRHFEPFGEHRFRSYWFELWRYYETRRGPSWTWERDSTGSSFTASKLKDPPTTPAARPKRASPGR